MALNRSDREIETLTRGDLAEIDDPALTGGKIADRMITRDSRTAILFSMVTDCFISYAQHGHAAALHFLLFELNALNGDRLFFRILHDARFIFRSILTLDRKNVGVYTDLVYHKWFLCQSMFFTKKIEI
jgi:hypothetical protein